MQKLFRCVMKASITGAVYLNASYNVNLNGGYHKHDFQGQFITLYRTFSITEFMYLPVFEKFLQISPKSSATAKDPKLSSSSTAYNVVLPLWGKNPGLWQVSMESLTVHSPLRPDTMPVAQA